MKLLICVLSLFFYSNLYAQEYATNLITPELLKNANMVVRKDQTVLRIQSISKAKANFLIAFTIFNKSADDYSQLTTLYDSFTSLSNLKVNVYNQDGLKIKSFNKSDFNDESLISGMYDDNRVKFLKISETTYPYTIEFSYTVDYSGVLKYPSWYTQTSFNVSVEQSSYQIYYPENIKVRFKQNLNIEPICTNNNGVKSCFYESKKLKAFPYESLSIDLLKHTPWVLVEPSLIEYDGSKGDLSTWETFGNWVYDLSKDEDVLPQTMITKVHEIADTIPNLKEKTKALYKYMQSKTRYVSVQLGIGGFKPISAQKVALNNYGDCKALSNYMKALLKEAGITSNLVVIGASNKGSLYSDFSSIGQANHMILCVPLPKDTVWLECTNQRLPFNYLGSFTDDRTALLITKDGGKLVHTPIYSPLQNAQIRKANLVIDAEGNATATIRTIYSGEQFDQVQTQIFKEAKEQKDDLYEVLTISNPEITSYNYEQKDLSSPSITENIKLKIPNLLTKVGNSSFLTPNLLNRKSLVPGKIENRITDFGINMNYYDRDEITYQLPSNMKIDFISKNEDIKSDFGSYKISISIANQTITYLREQTMYKNKYPAEKFNLYVDFLKAVFKADKLKVVLSSK
jgi:transglutaminase-like putative cysteine protease